MLWPMISGAASMTMSSSSLRQSKSGMSTSMVVSGFTRRMARIVSAQWPAPPSGRSSLSTDVSTACLSPMRRMDSATSSGSPCSGGNGLPVLVAQNLHERVQTSPSIMNVAVFLLQHSALLGHFPLSHIVCSPCFSTIFETSAYFTSLWSFIFSQPGFIFFATLS